MPRLRAKARSPARGAGLGVQVFRELLAHDQRIGLLVAALEAGQDAFEGVLLHQRAAALAQVGERDLFLRAVEHERLDRLREFLERRLDVEPEMRGEAREHLEIELVAPVPALDRAAREGQARVRDHAPGIEERDRSQAVALGAGAHGVVEGEQARLELGQRVVADRAGVARREQVLAARIELEHHGAAVGVPERRFEGFRQALLRVGAHFEAVDDHVQRVLDVLGEPGDRVDFVNLAVDAQAREPLRAQLRDQLVLLALAARDDGGEDHELGVLGKCKGVVDHLRHRLRLQGQLVLRAVRCPDARVEQAQVVVDLGDGAHGRARVVARRFLLDRDRGREPLDQIDVGLFHELQELARVGRERFDVAALAFRVERIEGERGFSGARQSRDHDQPVSGQIDVQVLEIVRARAADANLVHQSRSVRKAQPATIRNSAAPTLPPLRVAWRRGRELPLYSSRLPP